jgi:protein-L-isoaspartate(D-aspartate) O-methyltransferase
MLGRLREAGLAGEAVLGAMGSLPRHRFVDPALQRRAYGRDALPIGHEQTLSHPEVVALMSEALDVRAGTRVLEIGTGSGYQAALLARLGATVWTIERIAPLLEGAKKIWREIELDGSIRAKHGDGYLGWPEAAPFDRILLTAAPPEAPAALLGQLAEGGLLIMPQVVSEGQRLLRYRLQGDRAFREDLGACSFVPMLAQTVGGP